MLTVIDSTGDDNYLFPAALKAEMHSISLETEDVERVFRDRCPGCSSTKYSYAFPSDFSHYVSCDNCSSLYVQNILSSAAYSEYKDKLHRRVYGTDLYREFVAQLSDDYFFHLTLTLNKLFGVDGSRRIGALGIKTPVMREKLQQVMSNHQLVEWKHDEPSQKFDFLLLSHVLERDPDPRGVLDRAYDSLEDGGFLYVKSRVGSGLDLLTLWENSQLLPSEHLNLFTIEGVKMLLGERFEIEELSTPGALDLKNILTADDACLNKFMQYLKQHRNQRTVDDFQQFVQRNLLSSHLVLTAKKRGKCT